MKYLDITFKHKLLDKELLDSWLKLKEDHCLIRFKGEKENASVEEIILSKTKYEDIDLDKMIEKGELFYLYGSEISYK